MNLTKLILADIFKALSLFNQKRLYSSFGISFFHLTLRCLASKMASLRKVTENSEGTEFFFQWFVETAIFMSVFGKFLISIFLSSSS